MNISFTYYENGKAHKQFERKCTVPQDVLGDCDHHYCSVPRYFSSNDCQVGKTFCSVWIYRRYLISRARRSNVISWVQNFAKLYAYEKLYVQGILTTIKSIFIYFVLYELRIQQINYSFTHKLGTPHPEFTCSKSTMEAQEPCLESVQRQQ